MVEFAKGLAVVIVELAVGRVAAEARSLLYHDSVRTKKQRTLSSPAGKISLDPPQVPNNRGRGSFELAALS